MSTSPLAKQSCTACSKDAPLVTADQYPSLLSELTDWSIITEDSVDKLVKSYQFDNFVEALEFTNKVGALAELFNHHPLIQTEWGNTRVVWWTHKIKGLHQNDFILAAKTDELTIEN
jgi:4a-hydroxytetrahydrobiopterin dehydratase